MSFFSHFLAGPSCFLSVFNFHCREETCPMLHSPLFTSKSKLIYHNLCRLATQNCIFTKTARAFEKQKDLSIFVLLEHWNGLCFSTVCQITVSLQLFLSGVGGFYLFALLSSVKFLIWTKIFAAFLAFVTICHHSNIRLFHWGDCKRANLRCCIEDNHSQQLHKFTKKTCRRWERILWHLLTKQCSVFRDFFRFAAILCCAESSHWIL